MLLHHAKFSFSFRTESSYVQYHNLPPSRHVGLKRKTDIILSWISSATSSVSHPLCMNHHIVYIFNIPRRFPIVSIDEWSSCDVNGTRYRTGTSMFGTHHYCLRDILKEAQMGHFLTFDCFEQDSSTGTVSCFHRPVSQSSTIWNYRYLTIKKTYTEFIEQQHIVGYLMCAGVRRSKRPRLWGTEEGSKR